MIAACNHVGIWSFEESNQRRVEVNRVTLASRIAPQQYRIVGVSRVVPVVETQRCCSQIIHTILTIHFEFCVQLVDANLFGGERQRDFVDVRQHDKIRDPQVFRLARLGAYARAVGHVDAAIVQTNRSFLSNNNLI